MTTLPSAIALTGDPASDLAHGRILGTAYAPPVRSPAYRARDAAGCIRAHAQYITVRSDIAHRTAIVCAAIREWARACDIETRAGRPLPAWPLWNGVPRSPWDLSVKLARVDGASGEAVAKLAMDVEAWAAAWDGQAVKGAEVGT